MNAMRGVRVSYEILRARAGGASPSSTAASSPAPGALFPPDPNEPERLATRPASAPKSARASGGSLPGLVGEFMIFGVGYINKNHWAWGRTTHTLNKSLRFSSRNSSGPNNP